MNGKKRTRILAVVVTILMVFGMLPMTAGSVFADDDPVYTVTVEPGEGTGTAFTVQSTTIISRSDMISGNFDKTKGCFYLDDDGKVYYALPWQCPFTAPADKEFDSWQASFGGTYTSGSFDIAEKGDFTITALWKNQEVHSTADLTIPSNVNVQYGDTQTAFNIKVNSLAFNIDNDAFTLSLYDSVFTNADNETIPFTVSCNGLNARRNDSAGWAKIDIWSDSQPEYPYTYQGFINIRSEDLSNATPGSYSATLKYSYSFLDAGAEGTIALSMTIPGGLPPEMPAYTVKFDSNVPASASTTCVGSMDDQSFAGDEKKALSENGYSLPGYDFEGWNTKADGSGTAYDDKEEVENLSEDGGTVTLYAQWSGKPYTVEYWSDNDGSQKHVQTAYFDRPGTLDVYSDTAFSWNSDAKTLHGWHSQSDGSFLEDGDDFVNLCGAPDADGNVSDPVIVADWVSNGQIVVTVTKDGVPQAGLRNSFKLVQGSIMYDNVSISYWNGRYVFNPIPDTDLPEGEYDLLFEANGYPSASAHIIYANNYAASVVFDFCTVSLTRDPAYVNVSDTSIGGDAVTVEQGKSVLVLDGGTLSINTTVYGGYRFAGYTAVGVTPVWEDGDPTKATQSIVVRGKADIKALIEPIEYTVTVEGGTADVATAHVGETVTITADTPEQGKAFVQWAHVDGVEFANASSTSTTFTMPAHDVTVTAVTAPIVIQAIEDKVYTGESIGPLDEVKVSLQGVDILLTSDDYEVSFEDNLDAGDAKAIVTMKSPRSGSAETTFKILPADISTATVETAGQEYTGGELRPNPTVTWNGMTLEKDKDYTLSYTDNVNVGTATVTVTGKGNFDTATFASGTFTITKPASVPVSGILMAKLTAKGSNGLTLSWNEINGAEGYDIFFVHCGKNASWKLEKTIKDGKTTTWTKTGLTKKSAYKAYVKAWVMKDGNKAYVSTSPVVHAYTSGCTKNYTNPKSVTVKKTSVSLKKGKTYKIKASVKKLKKGKKLMPKSHAAKLRYKSSDTSVATVSSSGKIKAKGKGTCYVYVYAANGAYKKVRVTVK